MGLKSWKVVLIGTLVLAGTTLRSVAQESARGIKEALVHHPLYLRGLWEGNKLSFDSTGRLKQNAKPGPLTLSGVDILSVDIDNKKLYLKGQRVVLVADVDGHLQRKVAVGSRTHIFGSFLPGDKKIYTANEEIDLTIDADADGSFDAALKTIFADGLPQLADSVPSYWKCYAQGYFTQAQDAEAAKKIVDACVQQNSFERRLGTDTSQEGFVPPQPLNSKQPPATREAVELGVSGESVVHFSVSKQGIPVGFQIVRAVGAGLDEATMTALYQFRFQPATIHGQPVVADTTFTMDYQPAQ